MDNKIIKRRRLVESSEGMLEEVLKFLVENEFVDGKDLEMLAMTSKNIHRAATNEALWRSLCQSHFPFTKTIDLKEREVMGHRWWYWECQLESPLDDGSQAPMPPPSCRSEDISIVVNITYKGKVLPSVIFQTEELDHFIREGNVRIPIPRPLVFGRADKWISSFGGKYSPDNIPEPRDFCIAIKIIRSSDKVMSPTRTMRGPDCDHIRASSLSGTKDKHTALSNIDLSSVEKGRWGFLETTRYCLRNSPLAFEIISRTCVSEINIFMELEFDLYEGTHIALTSLFATAEVWEENDIRALDSSGEVTLLHYLSELAGVKYGR